MTRHIDSMPILPLDQMLRDASRGHSDAEMHHGPDTLVGDLACHVLALVDELMKATAACAVAHQHIDTYGVVGTDSDDPEKVSQDRAFEATGPFSRAVGHNFVSVYDKVISG